MVRQLVLILLAACALPACATITTGSSQSVTLITDPPGAICELQRNGAVVAIVNPTPGTVQISKSSRDLSVRCTRAGHSPGLATVPPHFQGMTAGNLLIGGVIGLGVDVASGALSEYPATITVTLPPERFDTLADRDAFFAARIAEARRAYGERIETARGMCGRGAAATCDASIATLEAERNAEITRLEALRDAATYTRS